MSAYVIAEIGNNHGGSVEVAFKMIEAAAKCGAHAVKFQRRNNKNLFTDSFYHSPYVNPNSFGTTYGSHRESLELPLQSLFDLRLFADKCGVDFICTPFDMTSVTEVASLRPDKIKIASSDIVYHELVQAVDSFGFPIIASTGCSEEGDIPRLLSWVSKPITVLHCVSSYPASPDSLNLRFISKLVENYGQSNVIGYSDHEVGIQACILAYTLGARVFEKHFTLDRSAKGTDNAFSLEPAGLSKLTRNLSNIDVMLGDGVKAPHPSELQPMAKMRKYIVSSEDLPAGSSICRSAIDFRVTGFTTGLLPYEINLIVGKRTNKFVPKFHQITLDDIE